MNFSPRPLACALSAVATALVVASLPARADDAQLIVLKAAGAAFKPGDKIAAGQSLQLAAGQSVSLIGADGKLIQLKGPYDGPAAKAAEAKAASVTDMLAPLVSSAKVETATPGVIRNAAEAGPDATAWVLDATRSGDFCAHLAVGYDLWRADNRAAETLSIQPAAGGKPVTVAFEAGKARAPLPDSLTFADGARYRITGGGKTVTITAHTIPDSVPLDRTAAAWFATDHCDAQAKALLKTL